MEAALVINSALLWLVVLANLLLTLALVRRINESRSAAAGGAQVTGLEAGVGAPDFTARTLNGDIVTRHAYAGRDVAFIFVSTHCGPCREIAPHVEAIAPTAKAAGVDLVLVSSDEPDETQAFVDELQLTVPVIVAPRRSSAFLEDYKATATPSFCFVDKEARVRAAGYPSSEWGAWKSLTDTWVKRTSTAPVGRG